MGPTTHLAIDSGEQGNRAIATEMRRTAVLGLVISLVLLLVVAGDLPRFAQPEPPATETELADGWQLASSRDVGDDGATVSRADYQPTGWHQVRTMPATVLQALEDTRPDVPDEEAEARFAARRAAARRKAGSAG